MPQGLDMYHSCRKLSVLIASLGDLLEDHDDHPAYAALGDLVDAARDETEHILSVLELEADASSSVRRLLHS